MMKVNDDINQCESKSETSGSEEDVDLSQKVAKLSKRIIEEIW